MRNYYNLKKAEEAKGKEDDTSSEFSVNDHALSDVVESELDAEGFDAEKWVKEVLGKEDLGGVLRAYGGILSDIRALDAEKKALVYDNYSKLIAATETIRKMRANMDPLNPMASTLDPAIAAIYQRANTIKEELRNSLPKNLRQEIEMDEDKRKEAEKRRRMQEAVRRVLDTPERLRVLVNEGRIEEAKEAWVPVLRVLEGWKEKGQGGKEVQECIDDGEAALRGDPPSEKSWVNIKSKR